MIRLLISIIIAILRILGITHTIYQAFAHLFVGGLIGAYIIQRRHDTLAFDYTAKLNLWLAIGLSIVEILCFLWFKFM